jgi:hypothetical protein
VAARDKNIATRQRDVASRGEVVPTQAPDIAPRDEDIATRAPDLAARDQDTATREAKIDTQDRHMHALNALVSRTNLWADRGDAFVSSHDVSFSKKDAPLSCGNMLFTRGDVLFVARSVWLARGTAFFTSRIVLVRRRHTQTQRKEVACPPREPLTSRDRALVSLRLLESASALIRVAKRIVKSMTGTQAVAAGLEQLDGVVQKTAHANRDGGSRDRGAPSRYARPPACNDTNGPAFAFAARRDREWEVSLALSGTARVGSQDRSTRATRRSAHLSSGASASTSAA